jgi:hypothetical protein
MRNDLSVGCPFVIGLLERFLFFRIFSSRMISLSLPYKREIFTPMFCHNYSADENDRKVHPTCGISNNIVIHFG